jgi:hypothetical protein
MSLALSIQGIVEMITNSPGTLTKLSDDGFYEPMPMFKGNNQDMRKYFGGKTYDEIKWVYGK